MPVAGDGIRGDGGGVRGGQGARVAGGRGCSDAVLSLGSAGDPGGMPGDVGLAVELPAAFVDQLVMLRTGQLVRPALRRRAAAACPGRAGAAASPARCPGRRPWASAPCARRSLPRKTAVSVTLPRKTAGRAVRPPTVRSGRPASGRWCARSAGSGCCRRSARAGWPGHGGRDRPARLPRYARRASGASRPEMRNMPSGCQLAVNRFRAAWSSTSPFERDPARP